MTATVGRPTGRHHRPDRALGRRRHPPHRACARPAARPRWPTAPSRAVLHPLLTHLQGGRLTLIEADGSVHRYGEPTDLDVTVHLRTPAVWREVVTRASTGLGGSYIDGWWDTDDLTGLVRLAIRNLDVLDRIRTRWDAVTGPVADRVRRLRPESLEKDRRDIEAHYDLGNDFFSLFLDPETMAYSCGLWDGVDDLASAQQAKFDRLLDMLELSPGDRLVEIGTGWGGLAERAARRGLRVTTTHHLHRAARPRHRAHRRRRPGPPGRRRAPRLPRPAGPRGRRHLRRAGLGRDDRGRRLARPPGLLLHLQPAAPPRRAAWPSRPSPSPTTATSGPRPPATS